MKKYRNVGLAIGALALLAAVAPGLAATIQLPTAESVPAAGQGTVVVQGFVVTDIDWTVDDASAKVTEVRFTIARSVAGAAVVAAAVADANAEVRVRLEKDGAAFPDWQECTVTAGAAVCDLAVGAQMAASDLGTVNVIAYDKN